MMTTFEGKWVFDSQLLIYSLDKKSPFYQRTQKIFDQIPFGKIQPLVAQQNILETERVFLLAYKLAPKYVVKLVKPIIDDFGFQVISPLPTTYLRCYELLEKSTGRLDLFDYYLAATMLDNGISQILTANAKDFSKIPGIKAVNPF